MKIAFIGPDMTGKSNIAKELSNRLELPVFKNSGEWKTQLDSADYFLNLLKFGGPFLMDFITQTNISVILDRFYPCELVYADAFNRETDMSAIAWMDREFTKAGGKFIVCLRKDYSGLVDDQYPDQLPTSMLEKLDELYRTFCDTTECEYLVLETDDFDLDRQVSDIIKFLEK
jgi:deoxyadenosine/deoxycytidine kinase|tara:strand:- start:11812 stop:12330 length:519 start_codon:yes stop_codon:yes gene_type:complete